MNARLPDPRGDDPDLAHLGTTTEEAALAASLTGRARPLTARAGRLWMVATAVLWSLSGLFVKAPLFADWPLEQRGPLLAFWRAVFAALVLLPTVRRPRWRVGLIPLGLAFTAMNLTYLTAMTLTTAANAIWLQNIAPWWVFLLGLLVFRERASGRDLVPLGFGLVGVGVILVFEARGQEWAGVGLGLASGVAYACVVLFLRHLRDENASWLIALCHLVAAVGLSPWAIHAGRWPTLEQLLALACFGALQMALPYLFLLRALRGISSHEAVGLGLIEPLLVPLWVYSVWGEIPAPWTIAGGALILLGLALRYGWLRAD